MTLPIFFVLTLVVAASLLLISNRLRPDLVALLVLVVLGLTGLVSAQDLFAGFSRSAVITILALFIVTKGLERTGATRYLGRHLNRAAGQSEPRAVLVVMLAAAGLSLVMNNIAAAAVLLPAAIGVSRHSGQLPSRLLMPLAFGALLGGMVTLFTTANILVSAALAEQGLQPFGVLDFVPAGLPMALAGVAFMAIYGRRLLPKHGLGGRDARPKPDRDLLETYGLRQNVCAAYVKPGSAMAGLSLAEGHWGENLGWTVVGISRGGSIRLAPNRSEEVLEGDVVLFTGQTDDQELDRYGLILTQDPTWDGQFASANISLVEVALSPRAAIAGRTLREINFRDKYDLTALAIWREGSTIREGLADIPLRFGDALLLQGPHTKIQLLHDSPDFLVLEEDVGSVESPRKAAIAIGLTTAAVVLGAAGLLPIAQATFAAAVLMILFNCLSMEDAYQAIEWRTVFLISGMLPLGLALTDTGAAALVGETLVGLLGGWGALPVAGGLFVVTVLLTQVIGGQVTPVVLAPIAVAAAQRLGADPRGLAIAVAMGASTAFLSPLGHPVNLLVMGPGGYTFRDYARVGLPLTGLLFVVLLVALPLFWGVR